MEKNKILFLICIEGEEANTENNLFVCLNRNQISNIIYHQLSSIGCDNNKLDWKRQNMLENKVFSDIFYKDDTYVECIIFSDGDLKGNQWKAIENTYLIVKKHLTKLFDNMKNIKKYNIWDHQYDKGQETEYFLWLLNPHTTIEEAQKAISTNSISSTKEKSLKSFYEIQNMNELKKRDFKLWNKFYALFRQEHHSNPFVEFVDVLAFTLERRQEFYQYSCFFKIFECVKEYWEETRKK